MEPLPPAGSPRRRGTPPPPLSPSSGSAFPAAADDGDDAAAVSRPCFTLDEWWLANVEGDDQKIAVAGTFYRNQILQEYPPAPIAKRLEPNVLETEDGAILNIRGSHNLSHTFRNGYSKTVCEKFLHEFPDWWQRCKLLYPKLTNTDTAPDASNSGEDSTQFYLDQFERGKRLHLEGTYLISKFDGIFKSFSHNDAVFQKSSHLLNGKPRFEEYTCDGDIATDENPAASSKAATGDQRTPVASLEVRVCCKVHVCCKETEHMSLTEKAAVDDEMSNGTPVLEGYTCNGDIPTNEDAAASNDDNERYTATSKEVNNMEIGLVTGSPSRERGHDDIATDVSLALAVECTNNVVSESVPSTPATCTYRKKTPVASLKSQVSWRQNQHVASNKKPVDRPQKQISPQEKCQTATRSPVNRNLVSYVHRSPPTCGKDTSWSITSVEDLNLKRSRSGRVIVPKLDEGYQNLVYGTDGSITGVTGIDSPTMLKWSESKTSGRKKRTG